MLYLLMQIEDWLFYIEYLLDMISNVRYNTLYVKITIHVTGQHIAWKGCLLHTAGLHRYARLKCATWLLKRYKIQHIIKTSNSIRYTFPSLKTTSYINESSPSRSKKLKIKMLKELASSSVDIDWQTKAVLASSHDVPSYQKMSSKIDNMLKAPSSTSAATFDWPAH